jgi:long-chain acyl-CoA synthetase
MIIRGGENIYPREIDDLLYTHPAVAAAAVIGVPDELYGEEVAAFVVLKDGQDVSEAEIIDFCKLHLADYKCPKTVHLVQDIPKGPTGKLLKRELAQAISRELAVRLPDSSPYLLALMYTQWAAATCISGFFARLNASIKPAAARLKSPFR